MNTVNNHIEQFYLSNNLPADKKTKISSLSNLDIEIPLIHRYLGLIFYVTDVKKFYTFRVDEKIPELLFVDNTIVNTFGIYVEDYLNIPTELNNLNSLGKIVYVFPLNVAFYYDGTNWKYYSGIYNLRTNIDLNNLHPNLRHIGARVTKDGINQIWNENKTLVPYITNTNTTENLNAFNAQQSVNGRLYKHREQLYQVIDNKVFKIGTRIIQTPNFGIIQGETKIHEVLFSSIGNTLLPPYINAKLWINTNINTGNNTNLLIPLNLEIFYKTLSDRYEIWCLSDYGHTGTLEIIY